MARHKNLTGANLHEPKGAATALSGQTYVADGLGSGNWTYSPLGWGYYLDNAAEQTFTTTASKLSIDGLGSLTNETYLPPEIRGSGSLWDTANDKITPIRLGDGYDIRLELPITTDSGASELTLELDIGGTSSPTIVVLPRFLTMAKTPPYTISIGFPLVVLTSTVITNGIQLFCKTDAGTVGITKPSILIKRDFDGNM